jgi:LysM repeat protein
MERTIDHGTNGAGTRNGRAKLSAEQAAAVRPRRDAGESLSSISREYGVSVQTIWQIYHGKNWKVP